MSIDRIQARKISDNIVAEARKNTEMFAIRMKNEGYQYSKIDELNFEIGWLSTAIVACLTDADDIIRNYSK